ncbi:hypothetical protein C7293_04150 [filamentous cyanobacterium CCT1]|nr:hypothetical protein C7293_04150 [filamentous cyanobacterium CCT1]PSN80217.1 hypothetical protein C8B47_07665 [filamentous cyanobacterium CCP4]
MRRAMNSSASAFAASFNGSNARSADVCAEDICSPYGRLNTYARLTTGRHAMKGPLANSDNRPMDFEPLPIQAVALSQQHFDQAVAISDRVVSEPRQWQTYLNALALFGFQAWFAEQAPDLALAWRHCSLFQPPYANLIEVAYGLRVNDVKLCLISTGGAIDALVKLPRAVVDLANFRAHLYIVVRVLEEQGQVQVLSFLRHDQWLAHQQANPLHAEPDWSYRVPVQWFDQNLHRLLLQFQCMEDAVQHTDKSTEVPSWAELQQDLTERLAQAESVETPLWQLLTWEEGAQLLTAPALVDWLYEVQTGQRSLVLEPEPAESLLQPVLNAGAWLRNELDELNQSLGWLLLPPLAELRGADSTKLHPSEHPSTVQPVVEDLELIRKQLGREGTAIPTDARCVYKALTLDDQSLGLYAMTWLLRDEAGQPVEWVLLLVLKYLAPSSPHCTVAVTVKDQTALLVEHRLTPEGDRNSIFAQVVGSWDETFQVTLTAETGETLSLPPFTFSRSELA